MILGKERFERKLEIEYVRLRADMSKIVVCVSQKHIRTVNMYGSTYPKTFSMMLAYRCTAYTIVIKLKRLFHMHSTSRSKHRAASVPRMTVHETINLRQSE